MNKTRLILCTSLLALAACSYMPSWMGGGEKKIDRLPGDRMSVLPPSQALAADTATQAAAFNLPEPVDNPKWAQHTGTFTAGTGNIAFSGSLENKTSARAGDGEEFDRPLVPRPVVADDMVFTMDAVGKLSAHDMKDISVVRWTSDGVAEEDEPSVLGGGLAWSEGNLFVTSGRGVIAAFNGTTGAPLWKKSPRTPFNSAPRVEGGKVFAITSDSQLMAFDATNGETLWSHRGIGEVVSFMNSVSPAISGGDVIVPYASGEIYSINSADGNPLWNDSLASAMRTLASSNFSGIGGDPVVDGDVVFAVSSGGKLAVFALTTGQKVWEKPVSSINTPWVAGDYLFVLTSDNTLTCFLKYTGAVRWSTKLTSYENEKEKEDPILWRGPVLISGKLAVVGSNGELKLVNAMDGVVADTKDIPDDIVTAPVVVGGRMFLISQDATLYALQ